MSQNEEKALIPKSTMKHIIRLLLRVVPLLPAPELMDIIEDLKRSRTSIDAKIQKAYSSLQETSQLIGELEQDLKGRTQKVNLLRQEYERYSQLADLEEGKAKAIIDQLELSIGKGRNRERWVNLLISLVSGIIVFILGIYFGPQITTWLGLGAK